MNTGIGDAINLAWKLAAVLRGRAQAGILDTYGPERIAFARRLVQTTDRVFQFITSRGPIADPIRLNVAPRLLSVLFHIQAVRRFMFLNVSQTKLNYRRGDLGQGPPRPAAVLLADRHDEPGRRDVGAERLGNPQEPIDGVREELGSTDGANAL